MTPPPKIPAVAAFRGRPANGPTPLRLGWRGRLAASGIAVGCLVVLSLARWVNPSPTGMGTHLQLGMATCGFLDRTGLPCGTCGMTTSFAHFARGQVVASFLAQPLGCFLALTAAAAVWVAGHAAVTARPAYRVLRRLPAGWVAGGVLTTFVAAWAWKMAAVIQSSAAG